MKHSATSDERAAGHGYEALFVPALFEPWTQHVIAAATLQPAQRVLDLACGTGVLARSALPHVGPDGHITGVDPAPGMVCAAQEIEPAINWVLASAEALPFADASFDRVLCQFGAMFFQDRAAAISEMNRVSKPNAHLAMALWHGVDKNPAYADLSSLLDAEVSKAAGDAVRMPFGLGDPHLVTDLLAAGGYTDIKVTSHIEQARFPTPNAMVEAELRGWLPLFGIHLSDEKIAKVLASAETTLAKYRSETGEAVFPTSAYVVRALKPAHQSAEI